jgi:hypothetical protein
MRVVRVGPARQFDWNADEFEQHPQPVAPVFQPELPARAVRFLAEHPRRTMWVGSSTAYTILGNHIAPWFMDWYLARKTVQGQLTDADGPPVRLQRLRAQGRPRGPRCPWDVRRQGS